MLQGHSHCGHLCGILIMKATDPRKAAEELKAAAEELRQAIRRRSAEKMKTALTIAGSDSSGGAGIRRI